MHRQHALLEQEHQSTTNQRAVQPVYHESPADRHENKQVRQLLRGFDCGFAVEDQCTNFWCVEGDGDDNGDV
jgi:hypothetical protein